MKYCGVYEKCFENGDKQWGHLGNTICANVAEIGDEKIGSKCFCGIDNQEINYYDPENILYKEITEQRRQEALKLK
jgi:hypothetical protein